MHDGFFKENIDQVRKLYAHKLRTIIDTLKEIDENGSFITVENTMSVVNLTLKIDTLARTICLGSSGEVRSEEIRNEMTDRMIESAAALGIKVRSVSQMHHNEQLYLTLSYDQIPVARLADSIRDLVQSFRNVLTRGGLDIPCVYEVIRLTNGKPQFLAEHYARLENSLGAIGKPVPFSCETLEQSIADLAEEGQVRDHNIRLEVDLSGHALLYLNPTYYPSPEQYAEGVRTELFHGERKNPHIKMMDQTLRDATDAAIKAHDLYEVILVDRDDQITEGSRSNVFLIKNGELYTSPLRHVLPGVTRDKIIDIAKEKGIAVHEDPIPASSVADFDAAFISGTSPMILPIASLGDVTYDVNDPLLRSLMKWYSEVC